LFYLCQRVGTSSNEGVWRRTGEQAALCDFFFTFPPLIITHGYSPRSGIYDRSSAIHLEMELSGVAAAVIQMTTTADTQTHTHERKRK
jgi:hypothetical protein